MVSKCQGTQRTPHHPQVLTSLGAGGSPDLTEEGWRRRCPQGAARFHWEKSLVIGSLT